MILNGTWPANHSRLPAAGDCPDQPHNRVSERHVIAQLAVVYDGTRDLPASTGRAAAR
jgi:hypothetical protein